MTAEEPIRPASDEQLELHRLLALDWLKDRGDGRQLEACFNAPYVLSLIARIEAQAATIREREQQIKRITEDRDIGLTEGRMLRAQNAAQAEEIRAAYGAIESLCSCGGMGPADPGVCDACRIYHAMKAQPRG